MYDKISSLFYIFLLKADSRKNKLLHTGSKVTNHGEKETTTLRVQLHPITRLRYLPGLKVMLIAFESTHGNIVTQGISFSVSKISFIFLMTPIDILLMSKYMCRVI